MSVDPGITIGAAFLLGFVGSAHCLGMCGGIAGALGLSARGAGGSRSRPALLAGTHSLARIGSYAAIGAVLGGAGGMAHGVPGLGTGLRVLAGAVLVGQGLRVLGLDLGFSWLERRGLGLWRRVSPRMRRLGSPGSLTRAAAIGAVWGLMPCGLVYTAAATSAATGSATAGAVWMAAFGLGTMPAMVATSLAAGGLTAKLRSVGAQRTAGVLLVAFGLFALIGVAGGGHGSHPAQHAPETSSHSHMHSSLDPALMPTCSAPAVGR